MKMMKLVCLIAVLIFFYSLAFAQDEDSITITTYYPSPYGVYKNLRVYPGTGSGVGSTCNNEGEMYYDSSSHTLNLCSCPDASKCSSFDLQWVPIGGAGTGGVPGSAWVNFNGSNCTLGAAKNECQIRAGYNINKVTRYAAGRYTLYWKSGTFSDGNYAISGTATHIGLDNRWSILLDCCHSSAPLTKDTADVITNQHFSGGDDSNLITVMAVR